MRNGAYYISKNLKADKINLSEDTKLYIKSGITLTLNVDKIDKGTIVVCKGGRYVLTEPERMMMILL